MTSATEIALKGFIKKDEPNPAQYSTDEWLYWELGRHLSLNQLDAPEDVSRTGPYTVKSGGHSYVWHRTEKGRAIFRAKA